MKTSFQILIESIEFLYGNKGHYFKAPVQYSDYDYALIWGVWVNEGRLWLFSNEKWYELESKDGCFKEVVEALNQVIGKKCLDLLVVEDNATMIVPCDAPFI
jgi:hypothetical protein